MFSYHLIERLLEQGNWDDAVKTIRGLPSSVKVCWPKEHECSTK